MPEKRPDETRPENPNLYRHRPLENGGTLFILEQVHGDLYPRRAIEQDIGDIAPDILLIENTFSVGPGLNSGQGFLNAAVHNLGIAKKLGIPVVLPDVIGTGIIDISDHPFDPSSNSIEADQITTFNSLLSKIAVTSLAAISFNFVRDMAESQNSSEQCSIVSRREFLKFGAQASLVLACVPSFLLPFLTLVTNRSRAIQINSSGSIDQIENGRLTANIDSLIYDLWQGGEETKQYILGLRDAKYIATAELASAYLQSRTQEMRGPKVGLVVGGGHAQYLENRDKHNTEEKRAQVVASAIKSVFVPTYRALLNEAGDNREDRSKIFARAVLDLNNITVAGVYKVIKLDSVLSEENLNPLGYLVCEDIASGVIAALRDEPELLSAYQTKLEQLRPHKI